jgi:ribosomal protein S18 acetylase RimI-like enzyme
LDGKFRILFIMIIFSRRRRQRQPILFSAFVAGLLHVFIDLYCQVSVSHALVVTSPRWQEDITKGSRNGEIQNEYIVVQPRLKLRIRSTAPEDISIVSTILAHALLEEKDTRHRQTQLPFNFKKHMEFLMTKTGMASMLHSRMDAMITGKKLWQSINDDSPTEDELNDIHKLRYLWSSEIFRTKLEKACKMSHEPHSWNDYNFACAPQDADKLFHKMMTAENVATGEIVGFCEVALLSQPADWRSEEDISYYISQQEKTDEMDAVPTIVNLVTPAEYRRRGIASSILRSASRYVQLQGCSNELALYVEEKNLGAVRMYERLGFKTAIRYSNQLYMKAEI